MWSSQNLDCVGSNNTLDIGNIPRWWQWVVMAGAPKKVIADIKNSPELQLELTMSALATGRGIVETLLQESIHDELGRE